MTPQTDPARFLDYPLLGSDGQGMFIRARIRGIDDRDLINQWIEVEVSLDRGDPGPRQKVIELLNQRDYKLKQQGERPDRLAHGPRRPPSMTSKPSNVEVLKESETARERINQMRAATDGGTDQ